LFFQQSIGRWPKSTCCGKCQLKAAREALDQAGLQALPVISLAKNPEQIFLEGAALPVILPAHSTLLQLLQRIRDEAHRFALDYHRRLRQRSGTISVLECIPGIGPKRRSALLQHFGILEALLRASPEQIEAVPGFSKALAQTLYQHLHGEKYLEQLMAPLRASGLIYTMRGNKGGYVLGRDPKEITLYDVISIVEGSLAPVPCVDKVEMFERWENCATRKVWVRLKERLTAELKAIRKRSLTGHQQADYPRPRHRHRRKQDAGAAPACD